MVSKSGDTHSIEATDTIEKNVTASQQLHKAMQKECEVGRRCRMEDRGRCVCEKLFKGEVSRTELWTRAGRWSSSTNF